MTGKRYARFEKRTLKFLQELDANNNREWFKANKTRYEEDVLDVALRFIQSMQDPLAEIAPHFIATPTRMGGSLMRVYRDTRFSRNKLPYKTNIGIQFRHERAKDVHSPGYYVHIDVREMAVEDCLKPQFQRSVETSFKQATDYMQFLCDAVGVKL